MTGLVLIILWLIGMGCRGLYRTLDQADEEGAIKKSVQDGATKLVEKFLK